MFEHPVGDHHLDEIGSYEFWFVMVSICWSCHDKIGSETMLKTATVRLLCVARWGGESVDFASVPW